MTNNIEALKDQKDFEQTAIPHMDMLHKYETPLKERGIIMNEMILGHSANQGSAKRQDSIDVVGGLPVPVETIKMMSDLMIQKEYTNKIVEMSQWFSNHFPKEK